MVICCVPGCGTDSWKCDTCVTFHDFPSNPDLAAKWIKQINIAVKTRPMWFPRGRPVVCSKHFLQTDFKGDTDSLKPRSIPTVFGHKYIGQNPEAIEVNRLTDAKTSPLIVKVIKPQEVVLENNNNICISKTNYLKKGSKGGNNGIALQKNVPVFSHRDVSTNYINNNLLSSKQNQSNSHYKKKLDVTNGMLKKGPNKASAVPSLKKNIRKKENNSDLIEIGPNTFLKINPDIIKVNKKLTPSGNTVLQFLMDQKLAKSQASDLFPKLIQGISTSSVENSNCVNRITVESATSSKSNKTDKDSISSNQSEDTVVHHVLGHLVDTHVCEESCADLKFPGDIPMDESQSNEDIDNPVSRNKSAQNEINNSNECNGQSHSNTTCIEKAPVLLTTKMPLSHCFLEKPKYILQLKQKSMQIASLKCKVSNLTKKIEELEDRCIVQERQLSYSLIKRLKTIRKNASKGDPCATYILELIRSYTNNSKMRWSESTLAQCAIWCRKAPYAYEYFKKAELFKLPCLGTVKRFIKKHPEIKFQKKINNSGPFGDEESSSDFTFDESDGQNDVNDSDDENNEPVACETILSVPSDLSNSTCKDNAKVKMQENDKEDNENDKAVENITKQSSEYEEQLENNSVCCNAEISENSNCVESNGIPLTVDSSNLELQEIILPSGEVVQCYSSSLGNGTDGGSQYFIIPNVGDQNSVGDHEYSVVPADSLPVILQNLENSQLHLQQPEQLIFIANSSDQVECSETEVTSA